MLALALLFIAQPNTVTMALAKRYNKNNEEFLKRMNARKARRNAASLSTPVPVQRQTQTSAANVSFATTITEETNSDNVTTDKSLSLPASDNREAAFVAEPTLLEKKHQYDPNGASTICVIGGDSLGSTGSPTRDDTFDVGGGGGGGSRISGGGGGGGGGSRISGGDGGDTNKGTTSCNSDGDGRNYYQKKLDDQKKKRKAKNKRKRCSQEEGASKKKKGKRAKDSNAPKQNLSSYFHYAKSVHNDVKASQPNLTVGGIAKIVSANWKELTAQERAHWEKKAEEDKVRYQKELAEYELGQGTVGENRFVLDLSDVPPQLPIPKSEGYAKEGASSFKGVSFHKKTNKWVAQARIDGKKLQIGYYKNEEEAAVDYARAVFKYTGQEGLDKAWARGRGNGRVLIDLSDVPPQLPIPKSEGCTKEGASSFTGVHFDKERKLWIAQVNIDGASRRIGYYKHEEEAAVDYARAVFKYTGQEGLDKMRASREGIDLRDVPPQLPIPKSEGFTKEGASSFTGVIFHKQKKQWVASITIDGKKRYIGSYKNEEEAAVNYARAVFKYKGQEALDKMRASRKRSYSKIDATEGNDDGAAKRSRTTITGKASKASIPQARAKGSSTTTSTAAQEEMALDVLHATSTAAQEEMALDVHEQDALDFSLAYFEAVENATNVTEV